MEEENLEQKAKDAKPAGAPSPSMYQVPQGDYRTLYQHSKDIEEAEQRSREAGEQKWGDDPISDFFRGMLT